MVERISRKAVGAQRAREVRGCLDTNFVNPIGPAAFRVVIDSTRAVARNVLNERAAEGNVYDLDAATDRKGRHAASPCLEDERNLTFVASLVRLDRTVRLLVITGWRDVLASRDEQAVDTVENSRRSGRRERRDDERQETDLRERFGVCEIHAHSRRPANDFCCSGNGNEGGFRHVIEKGERADPSPGSG